MNSKNKVCGFFVAHFLQVLIMASNESEENTAVEANNTEENGEVANEQQQQQAPRPGGWGMFKTLIVRMVIIYMISSFFRRPSPTQQGQGQAQTTAQAMNAYLKDTMMDMYVYVSEQEKFTDFNDPKSLFWQEEELVYGDWEGGVDHDGSFVKSSQIAISEKVQNNGSLYLHVYIVRAGKSPNPDDVDNYEQLYTIHKSRQMNKMKKRKFHTTKNLLTGTTDVHPDLISNTTDPPVEILSHWHPNLTINLVDDHTPWVKGAVPAPLDEFIEFQPGNVYHPILYFNDYWNLNQDFMPINDTTKVLNLTVTYTPLSLFRWQMYAAQSMRNRWYSFMGDGFMEENDDDQDSLKQTLTDTNPYLLGLTIMVSIVHSVFEFLAFKNDIQFWKNRKSLEGLSVRSVFFNVFQSLIVLLYVLDNETNFVVRVSVFIGLGIEIWKIHKVTDIRLDRENKVLGIFPRIKFDDKATYTESQTKKYDTLAFKYLSWLLFPLLVGYSVYSLMYQEHKSWYSWVLSLLYGFLLTFGFIMMTPQLFINYKMKSVAHLPWRMLSYKALNTFIDDLFAFVIKMPILYRIGCFRDDIVFVIFLYQRYIYPVDHKRVNEYGTSGEMLDNANKNGNVPAVDRATDAAPEQEAVEPEMNEEPKPAEQKKTD